MNRSGPPPSGSCEAIGDREARQQTGGSAYILPGRCRPVMGSGESPSISVVRVPTALLGHVLQRWI